GRAAVARRGREGHIAAGQAHTAIDRRLHAGDAERVTSIYVAVVGQQRRRRDHHRGVLVDTGRVGHGHRRVVLGINRQVHRGGGAAAVPVADGVGEGRRTVVIGRRREGDVTPGQAHA